MRESFVEALKRKYEAEIASAKATAEVVDLYNTAKAKQPNVSDKIDAEIVEDIDDAPEKVLAS